MTLFSVTQSSISDNRLTTSRLSSTCWPIAVSIWLLAQIGSIRTPRPGLVLGFRIRFEKQLGDLVAAFEACVTVHAMINVWIARPHEAYAEWSGALHCTTIGRCFCSSSSPMLTLSRRVRPEGTQKAILRGVFVVESGNVHASLLNWYRSKDLYFDRVSLIKMESWSKGRVALIGDAAFCVSLMAGQGSALAMTAAYVIAGELAKAEGRHEAAFGNYEALLRSYVLSKQEGARRFAVAFAPNTKWGLFLRNQVIRAFAIPGLARLAIGSNIADNLELP